MSDVGTSTYGDLIQEVFIGPIRSVLVVDDDFPTLDLLLSRQMLTQGTPCDEQDAQRVRDIIQFCHAEARRWMIEVHDGQPDKPQVPSHLTQSDLMILDFHLNKECPDEGAAAIEILRQLAENRYFNLVVVYTKGFAGIGGDIARVTREIAVGLCTPDERLTLHANGITTIETLLQEWEDDDPEIRGKLKAEIDDETFLKIRGFADPKIDWISVCDWDELQGLRNFFVGAPKSICDDSKFKLLTKWAFYEKQLELLPKLATTGLGAVEMRFGDEGVNWIRTDGLFVTVVSKSNDASSLPEHLLKALQSWDPEPYRLLMAKMRAVLDEHGALAEAEVLRNRHLQAGWLGDFMASEPDQRPWKFHNVIKRHWEGLGDAIRTTVTEFGERLGGRVVADGVERWYASLEPAEVMVHLNRYECSKKVEGSHLTTGHVLQIKNGASAGAYWLCLSPACDLEPGQKDSGWHKRLGEHIPFIAVELFGVPHARVGEALESASSANYLFLEIDRKLRCFSFLPLSPNNFGGVRDRTPNPKWEQMFAERQGRFDNTGNRFQITRTAGGSERLALSTYSATVVAQLRYEYALNLLQRLGASLSRVGLDFVPMTCRPLPNGQTDAQATLENHVEGQGTEYPSGG
ncbi:MAG: hypothetical protein JZU52_05005 [Lamprocystis purpurea]|jgi:hypothetical protein|uniref:response regulator receiver domain n=1 Tax=Lamprocystis purpurea TaxID=61598 RepID=UPI000364EA38|nr:response regulator receiver domain [Lamprocystis purpurea]MBV5273014.1 hypothetical protein [Lamprocystis purpurea]